MKTTRETRFDFPSSGDNFETLGRVKDICYRVISVDELETLLDRYIGRLQPSQNITVMGNYVAAGAPGSAMSEQELIGILKELAATDGFKKQQWWGVWRALQELGVSARGMKDFAVWLKIVGVADEDVYTNMKAASKNASRLAGRLLSWQQIVAPTAFEQSQINAVSMLRNILPAQ